MTFVECINRWLADIDLQLHVSKQFGIEIKGHGWTLSESELIPSTLETRSGERRTEMYRVDITADLNDEDETGYVWTFLDEASDPGQIKSGAIVVAGDQDAAAVCEVIDLAPAGDGTIVHLRLLPGLVEDYRALVERALAS
jgi:hypothetical protein